MRRHDLLGPWRPSCAAGTCSRRTTCWWTSTSSGSRPTSPRRAPSSAGGATRLGGHPHRLDVPADVLLACRCAMQARRLSGQLRGGWQRAAVAYRVRSDECRRRRHAVVPLPLLGSPCRRDAATGWCRDSDDKLVAVLRGLPKDVRRELVPIPDSASRLRGAWVPFGEGACSSDSPSARHRGATGAGSRAGQMAAVTLAAVVADELLGCSIRRDARCAVGATSTRCAASCAWTRCGDAGPVARSPLGARRPAELGLWRPAGGAPAAERRGVAAHVSRPGGRRWLQFDCACSRPSRLRTDCDSVRRDAPGGARDAAAVRT
jgi:hypothetical protein